jgi:transglutaminase-like putative cysteine protease
MRYRYSWLAGLGALVYLLYLLSRLLTTTVEGVPWLLVVIAALVLGVGITSMTFIYRLPTWLAGVANAAGALVAAVWIAARGTTASLLPTRDTWTALREELSLAMEVLRSGVDPVSPYSGLVVLLLVLFWTLGFLLAWGLWRCHPYVALLPPIVVALQFATIDRQGTTLLGSLAFVSIVAACLLAVALDRRRHGTGQMVAVGEFSPTKGRLSRTSIGFVAFVVVASIAVGSLLGAIVPNGFVKWPDTGRTGADGGPVSYNAFIGIRQHLIATSDTPVFAARIEEDVPADQVYFSLTSMGLYDGERFSPSTSGALRPGDDFWLGGDHRFSGPVKPLASEIEILQLSMPWLPSVTRPVGFATGDRKLDSAVRITPDDGSLHVRGGLTTEGMRYRVTSEIPAPDIGALAWNGSTLSPAFQAAEEAGEEVPERIPLSRVNVPPNIESYRRLPGDLDNGIEALARQRTRNLTTPFEKAIALEKWFREEFRYSTDITPGHGATDLAAWLLESDSPNHRVGYCENFATSMAVMARTLDIPSRVVLGFTPGTPQNDGTVVVYERNAHAWVELWMPTQGWVRFDPTPRSDGVNPATLDTIETLLGFAIGDYLDAAPGAVTGDAAPPPSSATTPPRALPSDREVPVSTGLEIPRRVMWLILLAAIGLSALGSVPFLKWWRRQRRLRRLRSGDISAAWDQIVARLDDLGAPPNPADTPSEVATKVTPSMAPLAVVYTRSVYGEDKVVAAELVAVATDSLARTEQQLVECHSRAQRLRAGYRIRTLLPRRWPRSRG